MQVAKTGLTEYGSQYGSNQPVQLQRLARIVACIKYSYFFLNYTNNKGVDQTM